MLSAALTYARHGWHVFPLHPGQKTPILKGGVHCATTDADIIARWWQRFPTANIGIALAKSGIAVIDVDVKAAKNIDGRPIMDRMSRTHGTPSQVVQSTPSSGKHYLVLASVSVDDKVSWRPGIDLLSAAHRYIVAYPSIVDGVRYSWNTKTPWKLSPMPAAWLPLVAPGDSRTETGKPGTGAPDASDPLQIASLRIPEVHPSELDQILMVLKPSMGRDEWLRVIWGAAAQWRGTEHQQAVIDKIEAWSSLSDKPGQYKKGEVAERFAEHNAREGGNSGAGHVTWRSVRSMGSTAGWNTYTMDGIDATKWESYLTLKTLEGGKKKPHATSWNVILLLAFHASLRGGIRRNDMTKQIELHTAAVAPFHPKSHLPAEYDRTADLPGIKQSLRGLLAGPIKDKDLEQSIQKAAAIGAYDPLHAWMDTLHWDGVSRINTWLQKACHAADTELNRAMGRAWLIGLALRACVDTRGRGAKMDSVLILQGESGIGKSTIGAILGGDFYSEFVSSLNDDKIYYAMERSMVVEFPELSTMRSSDVERVKALVTVQADLFRRVWGTSASRAPRRCVFLGTVNPDGFLTSDMTARRWWVVNCPSRKFDLEWLKANRSQLIAEARHLADMGEQPVLPECVHAAHAAVTSKAQIAHPYEEPIRTWTAKCSARGDVRLMTAVEEVLGRTMVQLKRDELRRFTELLKTAGWVIVHTKAGNVWRFMPRAHPKGSAGV